MVSNTPQHPKVEASSQIDVNGCTTPGYALPIGERVLTSRINAPKSGLCSIGNIGPPPPPAPGRESRGKSNFVEENFLELCLSF